MPDESVTAVPANEPTSGASLEQQQYSQQAYEQQLAAQDGQQAPDDPQLNAQYPPIPQAPAQFVPGLQQPEHGQQPYAPQPPAAPFAPAAYPQANYYAPPEYAQPGYPQPGYPSPYGAAPVQAPGRSKYGTAGLVFGIVAIVASVIPFLAYLAWMPAMVAVILGIVILAAPSAGGARKDSRGITALILGAIAFFVAIIMSIVSSVIISSIMESSSESAQAEYAEVYPEEVPAERPMNPVDAPLHDEVTYTGTGDSVVRVELPQAANEQWLATITHDGADWFTLEGLDADNELIEFMSGPRGPFTAEYIGNAIGYSGVPRAFQIEADGNWTITVKSASAATEITEKTVSGTNSSVLLYNGKASIASISSADETHFSIVALNEDYELLVNETGPYSGDLAMPTGPVLLLIDVEGDWTITFE